LYRLLQLLLRRLLLLLLLFPAKLANFRGTAQL